MHWKLGGNKEVRGSPYLSPLEEAQIQGLGKPKRDVGGLAHSQTPSIFFLVLHKKPCNMKQVLKNQKETQSIKFTVVHVHNPWGQVWKKPQALSTVGWGCEHMHVYAYIYTAS